MIFKRLLSNIIDFLVYCVVYFFIYKLHGFEDRTDYSILVQFYTYVFIFIIPVLALKNTIGKKLLRLEWGDNRQLNFKLLLKYSFYFLIFTPSFSILSALITFPFWNTNFIPADKSFALIWLLVFIMVDTLVYFLSVGRYHIIDYILKLNIRNHPFKNTALKNLSFVYLTAGAFLVLNFIQHKYHFSLNQIEKSLGPEFRKEQFPNSTRFGVNAFTTRKNSTTVLIPSEPASLLFKKELRQKTIYAIIPKNYFKSKFYREKISYDLIIQSNTNNIFSGYKPDQTRLMLANIEKGFFGEITTTYYIYYYDNSLPSWKIYGGFDTDSTTISQYVNLTNASLLEQYKNPHEELSLDIRIEADKMTFALDSVNLVLDKIPFKETEMHGQVGYSYPSNNDFTLHMTYFLQGQVLEVDDKVAELVSVRNEVTDKNL
jgi:hypothetical protein